jgi:hypothetical protein
MYYHFMCASLLLGACILTQSLFSPATAARVLLLLAALSSLIVDTATTSTTAVDVSDSYYLKLVVLKSLLPVSVPPLPVYLLSDTRSTW